MGLQVPGRIADKMAELNTGHAMKQTSETLTDPKEVYLSKHTSSALFEKKFPELGGVDANHTDYLNFFFTQVNTFLVIR